MTNAYNKWHSDNPEAPDYGKTVTARLKKQGAVSGRAEQNTVRGWKGVRLISQKSER
jgi:hypothetical protein